MPAMRQFVNHHVVQQLIGQIVELIIKVYISFCAAASPSGSLIADGDSSDSHSHFLAVILNPPDKFLFYLLNFFFRQLLNGNGSRRFLHNSFLLRLFHL